jgi:hypothetical protein
MSTAASDPPPSRYRYRGTRRGDSPAAPLLIVLSGALLVAVGAGIAVHNLATSNPPIPDRAGGLVRQTPIQGGVLPTRPSTRAGRDEASRVPVPAVPPTVSPVPVPSPAQVTYEAEAPGVIRSDGVQIFPFVAASGGQVVGNVRDGRTVRFVSVAAEGGGDYAMVVFYVARSPHVAQVRVNDDPPVTLPFPAVPDNAVGSVTLRVPLLVGLNTVEFGGDCAALDRIAV